MYVHSCRLTDKHQVRRVRLRLEDSAHVDIAVQLLRAAGCPTRNPYNRKSGLSQRPVSAATDVQPPSEGQSIQAQRPSTAIGLRGRPISSSSRPNTASFEGIDQMQHDFTARPVSMTSANSKASGYSEEGALDIQCPYKLEDSARLSQQESRRFLFDNGTRTASSNPVMGPPTRDGLNSRQHEFEDRRLYGYTHDEPHSTPRDVPQYQDALNTAQDMPMAHVTASSSADNA